MKTTDYELTMLEVKHGDIVIESDVKNVAITVNKKNNELVIINRKTGYMLRLPRERVNAFAYELLDIMDIYFPKSEMWKGVV